VIEKINNNRPPFILVQPSVTIGGLTLLSERASLIEVLKGKENIWEGLTGGGHHKREYALNLSDYPEIYAQVEKQ
jgi:hypothetical protein